jgi:hypothetical protein
MDKLATMDTIGSSFRPWLSCQDICLLNRHQTGDTDSVQPVILLPVQRDSQETFIPCEARMLWYSADRTSSQQLRDTTSFRASSRVLKSLELIAVGLLSWVPHLTTGIGWALRLGLHCLQQAQRPLDAQWVCIADFTVQIGCQKALIVLRVPVSACSQGKALTLKQVEVIGLSLGETWNGARVSSKYSVNPSQE